MASSSRRALALAESVQSETDRAAMAAETENLIRAFGGDGAPADLISMAETLEAIAPAFGIGRDRLRLWAAELRMRTRRG